MVSRFLRPAIAVCGIAAGALVGGAPAVAATPSASVSGSSSRAVSSTDASVSRGVCTTSLDDPQGRAAGFVVKASRSEGSAGFGFTAVLEEKPANGSWTALTGSAAPPGFGTFQPASSGAGSMLRRITVRGLRMGSAYRLKVTFRWTTASGKQTLVRRSSACTIKELRPNLGVARSLGWTPGTSGNQVVYRARLRVARATALTGRTVTLSVLQGGTLLGSATVQPLVHGATALVPGVRCTAGSDVTIRIAAEPTVEERTLADNELTAPCAAEPGAQR